MLLYVLNKNELVCYHWVQKENTDQIFNKTKNYKSALTRLCVLYIVFETVSIKEKLYIIAMLM